MRAATILRSHSVMMVSWGVNASSASAMTIAIQTQRWLSVSMVTAQSVMPSPMQGVVKMPLFAVIKEMERNVSPVAVILTACALKTQGNVSLKVVANAIPLTTRAVIKMSHSVGSWRASPVARRVVTMEIAAAIPPIALEAPANPVTRSPILGVMETDPYVPLKRMGTAV